MKMKKSNTRDVLPTPPVVENVPEVLPMSVEDKTSHHINNVPVGFLAKLSNRMNAELCKRIQTVKMQ